jgi:2-keto-4-pentenoate hydratase/2-oxohepta-3-ene-1,7-dioic acid hydratase in catechol pathway
MILIRYRQGNQTGYGLVERHTVYALEGDPFGAWTKGAEAGELADVELLAPCTPTKIVCIGRNYPAHAEEHGAVVPAEPLIFLKPPSAVIGPEQPIVLTPLSQQVEHEGEMAVVIGKRCRNVAEDAALDYVLGYTCGNDVTARDLQRKDGQWSRAKGFDSFCPLGPWIVTGFDASDAAVTCRVNGRMKQFGVARDMVFPIARLIAHISAAMTLEPGDVILTGTPSGVGPLNVGDVCEVEVEGIGVLRNPVVAAG